MKEELYTIVDFPVFNKESGKYKSPTPLGAAKKVFTRLEKNFSLENNITKKRYLEFTLRNLRTNKFYTYLGTKVLLHGPITINLNGKKRTINYKHLLCRKPNNINVNTLNTLIKNYNKASNHNNQNSY